MVNQTCSRVFLVEISGKSCVSGRREGLRTFLHSDMKNEDGERGGWLKKSFFLRSRVGYGFDTRQPRSRSRGPDERLRRLSKYELKYLPIDYGIIMHRMVRVDYRRAKRKKKKRADFSTVPWPWAAGRLQRCGRYLYRYRVHTVGASPQERPVSWKAWSKSTGACMHCAVKVSPGLLNYNPSLYPLEH